MEYKRITDLQNTYPQTGNYISDQFLKLSQASGLLQYESNDAQEKAQISLFGKYADKNVLRFTTKTLKNLIPVEGTNFRFILAIFKDYSDTNPVYFASQTYYNDLNAALVEANPYFLQASFDSANVVSFVYEDVVNIVKNAIPIEQKSRVDFRTNIFVASNGNINLYNLVKYIDWLVDKPSPLDDVNGGVLHPETIAGWNVFDGNWATGEVLTTVSASYGIGKEFVIIEDKTAENAAMAELAKQQKEQRRIESTIKLLEDEIKNQKNYFYPLAAGAYAMVNTQIKTLFGITAKNKKSLTKEEIEDEFKFSKKYQTNLGPTKGRQTRKAAITELILKDLNIFKKDLDTKKQEVAKIVANINEIKNTIKDAKAKAEEALNSLNGKIPSIPKIPKLPDIPKIPKLPKTSDLLALLPLPVLPALPKLPSLPKFGKPKLPKVPKIKLKKPKEPKKVKKNKGKGLKGALAGLQDAAGKVQGSIAAATAAAAGATAAVAGAAAAAKSAVANAQSAVENAKSAAQGAVDSAKGAVKGAVDSAKSAVANAQSSVQGTIDSTKSAVSNIEKSAKDELGKLNGK